MRLAPNSSLKIYSNVKVGDTYTMVFSSATNREAYFARHLVADIKPVQIVKKTGMIKVPLKRLNGVMLEDCNYISFQNPHYDNKLYYAVITSKDYLNNETGVITYSIDNWMTDMFNLRIHSMFIERQHVSMSEWQRLQSNPFDPNVIEMRTMEYLIADPHRQKRDYVLGDDVNSDAFMLAKPQVEDEMFTVVYISPFDVDSLGGEFKEFWNYVVNPSPQAGHFVIKPSDDTVYGMAPVTGQATWNNMMAHPYYVVGFWRSRIGVDAINFQSLIDNMTRAGLQDTVLGVYDIPMIMLRYMFGVGDTVEGVVINTTSKDKVTSDYNHADPKLMNFPFAYLKVQTPDGKTKEYKYEDFVTNQNGQNTMRFAMTGDLAERPTLMMNPDEYLYQSTRAGNPLEGIIFEQFPTAPYAVDAWDAQMAAIATNMIANADASSITSMVAGHGFRASKEFGWIASLGDAVDSLAGAGYDYNYASGIDGTSGYSSQGVSTGSALSAGATGLNVIGNVYSRKRESELTMGAWESVNATRAGARNNGMTEMFGVREQAYVEDIYLRSNGDGKINYNKHGFLNVLFTHVRLNLQYLQWYTAYFATNGYKCGKCEVPHVLGYVLGNDEPAWRQTGGDDSTFIQTVDAQVQAHDLTSTSAIKAMLDAGIRMYKGESLA